MSEDKGDLAGGGLALLLFAAAFVIEEEAHSETNPRLTRVGMLGGCSADSDLVSRDRDGDGVIGVVYKGDPNSGEWWKAEHTDSRGNPIWQPTDKPPRPEDEDRPKPDEQEE